MKRNLLAPLVLVFVLFASQGCYTQLALFHPPTPEEQSAVVSEDDYPYEINYIYSDFEPFLSSFSPYGDPFYRYGYNNWGFSDYYYGLSNQLGNPYGYGYYGNSYGYTNPAYLTAFTTLRQKRNWDRRGGGSNLSIRRSEPQTIALAKTEMRRVKLVTPGRSSYDRHNNSYDGRRSNRLLTRSSATSSYGTLSSGASGSGAITRSSSGAGSSSGSPSVSSKRNN